MARYRLRAWLTLLVILVISVLLVVKGLSFNEGDIDHRYDFDCWCDLSRFSSKIELFGLDVFYYEFSLIHFQHVLLLQAESF